MMSYARVIINPDDTVAKQSSDVPKEFDIFYRTESEFLPGGKTFADLTPEEREKVRNQYRFDPLKPGCYQGITGFSGAE